MIYDKAIKEREPSSELSEAKRKDRSRRRDPKITNITEKGESIMLKNLQNLKKRMTEKMNHKKGFTLAELLIVVAIISVMVAVSIPIFTSKLEKAREATDLANMRSAKAAAVATYLDNTSGSAGTYYYDANGGKLVGKDEKSSVKGYGKGTTLKGDESMNGQFNYNYEQNVEGYILKVDLTKDGDVTLTWEK